MQERNRKTEAQKRADAKYKREKTQQFSLRFFPADADIWEHLQGKQSPILARSDTQRHSRIAQSPCKSRGLLLAQKLKIFAKNLVIALDN